jgi:hypothetical protein
MVHNNNASVTFRLKDEIEASRLRMLELAGPAGFEPSDLLRDREAGTAELPYEPVTALVSPGGIEPP